MFVCPLPVYIVHKHRIPCMYAVYRCIPCVYIPYTGVCTVSVYIQTYGAAVRTIR